MLFGNDANNNSDRRSVSTRGGIDLRNENGFDPSMISFDFWKSCISLRLHPVLPKEKQSEYKKFDFETTMSTALTPQNAWLLLKNIEAVIIPAIKNNEKKFVGVIVNGDGLVGVGSGRIDGSQPYIGVFKGLDLDTKKPSEGMCYQFKENVMIEDYDYETGKFEMITIPAMTELELFMVILKEGIKASTNAQTHSLRTVQDFYNSTLLDTVNKIAQKNGISTSSNSFRGNNRQAIFGENSSSNTNELEGQQVESISQEVDNINQFLD